MTIAVPVIIVLVFFAFIFYACDIGKPHIGYRKEDK